MAPPLTTQGLVTLYQLDATMFPNGQWFYFTSASDFDTDIFWGGQLYSPIPMQAEGFEMSTRGQIPTPTITFSNLFGAGDMLLGSYEGLVGADVVRVVTLRRFLDDGTTPDGNAFISRDKFTVSQKTSHNAIAIAFKLAAKMDQEGLQLPRRLILRDICSHTYRRWVQVGPVPESGYFDYSDASCPFTGGAYFDANDQPVPDYQDLCSRTMTGCLRRFPGGQTLPARFFPAVGKVK